jgi:hypothetical protein
MSAPDFAAVRQDADDSGEKRHDEGERVWPGDEAGERVFDVQHGRLDQAGGASQQRCQHRNGRHRAR